MVFFIWMAVKISIYIEMIKRHHLSPRKKFVCMMTGKGGISREEEYSRNWDICGDLNEIRIEK